MFHRRRCWPYWISIKIVVSVSIFFAGSLLVLPSSVNPFDMTWKFVTIETNIPIVSIYILLEKISTFQPIRTAMYGQENLHFLLGMEKAALINFHIFDIAIGTKKKWITCYSHLEFSSRFVILVRGFSVAFIICIKCQKLKLFNEYKQVKNLWDVMFILLKRGWNLYPFWAYFEF